MKKLIRLSFFFGFILIGLFLLTFLLISPISKYIIENKSEEWIGRKVKIESLWINIFTGSVHIENFKMFENKSDKTFVSFADFYCNIEVLKILTGKYVISPVTLTKPEINIIETGTKFNFDDLIKRFADTAKTKSEPPSEPVKYYIDKFSIASGIIHYSSTIPVASISILEVNVSTNPVAYTDSIYNVSSDFLFKSGGEIKTLLTVNANSLDYKLKFNSSNYKLVFLTAYMRDYLKVKSFDATLTSDFFIKGNFNQPQEVAANGKLEFKEFSIVDTTGDKLSSFANFNIDIDSLNTKEGIYNFRSIELNDPYIKFGIYADGTNFDRVLVQEVVDSSATAPVEEFTNIFQMMAGYVKSISTEYLLKEYRIDHLNMKGGHIIFTDYTLEDKFQFNLDSMNISSNNFNLKNDRIDIALSCRLNNSGVMKGSLSVNPHGYEDMDIYYKVSDLLISDINPYSKYYVATPFVNGKILFENKTTILNNQLKSTNKLFIEKILVGGKTSVKGLYDLPVKLAVAILRDPKGNIDFEIPVEGNLNDPNFKLRKVIWQIFKNLIIKAATAPYKLFVNAFGGKEEDYKELTFQYFQQGINEDQKRVLGSLTKVLKEKSDINIEFIQVNSKDAELEQLAVYKAKKQYLSFTNDSLSEEQQLQVMQLSNKDSAFLAWVDTALNHPEALTSIHDKCIKLIGKEKLISEVNLHIEQRDSVLLNYLVSNKVSPERIKISQAIEENLSVKESTPKYLINFFVNENTDNSSKLPPEKK